MNKRYNGYHDFDVLPVCIDCLQRVYNQVQLRKGSWFEGAKNLYKKASF